MYMKSSSSGTRAASTNARGMPSAWAALNNMCILSNGWARRHVGGDVMTSMYKNMCGETGVIFLLFSMRSVCVLSILSVKSFLFGVVCPISSIRCLRDIIRARAAHGTSSVSLPANSTWLQVTHTACARSAWERRSMHSPQLEGAGCPHCDFLPMHVLRSWKALFDEKGAFISVSGGAGSTAGEAKRRRPSWGSQVDLLEGMETGESLSPFHPSDSTAVLRDRKPALRLLLPEERTRSFSYLPLRRMM